MSEAIASARIFRDYLSSCVDVPDHVFSLVSQIEDYLVTKASRNLVQKDISDFFVPK